MPDQARPMGDADVLAVPAELESVRGGEPTAHAERAADDVGPQPLEVDSNDETLIAPLSGWPTLGLGELWRYRDLVFQLTVRNIKVRYKQTLLGVAWSVLQPVLMMLVFAFTVRHLIPGAGGSFPYPVFVLSGLLPWIFFQTAVTSAANSVVGSEGLVTKVYFPRLAIPLAAVVAALFDLGIAFFVLLAVMLWYGIVPTSGLALLPLAVLLLVLAAMGSGTLIAALAVSYRDFRHAVPFVLQAWMIATPTIYADLNVGRLSQFNPLIAPINFFRACMLGLPVPWQSVLVTTLIHGTLCLAGILYFRHVEDAFADVI